MTTITAEQVSKLRQRTGVGMLAVKKALEEAAGDEEKAIDILRKRGEAQAVKRAGRERNEGIIFLAQKGNRAALVHLGCETDFVARGDDFRAAGQKFADTALSGGEEAAKKLAESLIPELVNKLGENIGLADTRVIEAATLGVYLHTNEKVAVAIGLEGGTTELARDAAMHATAMAPDVVSPDDVPQAAVEKEREIWIEQLKSEGKPEAMLENIMKGKERKFRSQHALLTQEFVKDPTKTVEKHLAGAKVTVYVRMAV